MWEVTAQKLRERDVSKKGLLSTAWRGESWPFYSELKGVKFWTGKRSFEDLKLSPPSLSCKESPEVTVVGQSASETF